MEHDPNSLVTEEMRRAVGVESEPGVIEVEKETIRRLADSLQDPNPLWRDEEYAKKTPYGGIIAFPIAFHPASRAGKPRVQYTTPTQGGVVASDAWEFLKPIRYGDTITMTSKVADFSEREGHTGKVLVMVREATYRNQHGRVVMRERRTSLSFGPKKAGDKR